MVKKQIEHDLGFDPDEAILASGKAGLGIEDIFEAIVTRIPPPKGDEKSPLQGLIFDSHYDEFRGVVVHTRIFEGSVKPGDNILFMNTNKVYTVEEVGYFKLKLEKSK